MSKVAPTLHESITNDETMVFSYPTYKDMADNDIIFCFRGIVTSDLVSHVLEIMNDKLDEQEQDRKFAKKFSNVMVECLTNVYADEDSLADEFYDPNAMLMVRKLESCYIITTGNYIAHDRVASIKKLIVKLNAMSSDEVKEYYKTLLGQEIPNIPGPSDLSIVDLARKSKNDLVYHFKFENKYYTYFALEASLTQ